MRGQRRAQAKGESFLAAVAPPPRPAAPRCPHNMRVQPGHRQGGQQHPATHRWRWLSAGRVIDSLRQARWQAMAAYTGKAMPFQRASAVQGWLDNQGAGAAHAQGTSKASELAQASAICKRCAPRTRQPAIKAFCAPIATIKPALTANPENTALCMSIPVRLCRNPMDRPATGWDKFSKIVCFSSSLKKI